MTKCTSDSDNCSSLALDWTSPSPASPDLQQECSYREGRISAGFSREPARQLRTAMSTTFFCSRWPKAYALHDDLSVSSRTMSTVKFGWNRHLVPSRVGVRWAPRLTKDQRSRRISRRISTSFLHQPPFCYPGLPTMIVRSLSSFGPITGTGPLQAK